MSDEKKHDDGGQAHPQVVTDKADTEFDGIYADTYSHGGMSYHQWLVGQALAGLIGNPEVQNTGLGPEKYADECFLYADAVIAEYRKRGVDL